MIAEQVMEFHEVANIFPMMGDDEYRSLVADVRTNGLREPIWTYQGKIIDGRNRYRACIEIGVKPQYREWNSEGSLVAFVVSLNLQRRHLTSSQKAMVALEVEKQLSDEAKEKERQRKMTLEIFPKSPAQPIHAAKQASTIMGTNHHYVTDAKRIVEQAPELKDAVLSGTLNIPEAKSIAKLPEPQRIEVVSKITSGEVKNVKEAKAVVRQEEKQEAFQKTVITLEHCNVYHCSVAELHLHVDPESIDCIVTDPPYPREYLPVYADLAEFAAYALKPGGSLIAMVGQSYLPEIMEMLQKHLSYQWLACYFTPGPATQIWQRNVNCSFKPLLWYVKGTYTGTWISDVFKSEARDKTYHEWGQSESGMSDVISRLTSPGELICDPFAGGGATAAAAALLKRRFVGCDVEKSCVQDTLYHVQEVLNAQ